MNRTPDEELQRLCREIVAGKRSIEEWRATESDDEFQSENYVGGYVADDDAFFFSHYDANDTEWWFRLTVDEARRIAEGNGAWSACISPTIDIPELPPWPGPLPTPLPDARDHRRHWCRDTGNSSI